MRAPSKNVGRRLDSRFFLLSYAKSTTFDVLRHIRAVTHRATRGARVGRLMWAHVLLPFCPVPSGEQSCEIMCRALPRRCRLAPYEIDR